MNNTRSALLCLVLLVMVGCGGGGGGAASSSTAGTGGNSDGGATAPPPVITTYTVGGNVAGVRGTGVTLQVNGHSSVVVTQDGAFTFADKFSSGASYQVAVASQPANPDEMCVVSAGSGTIASANVSNVGVSCVKNDVTPPTLTDRSPRNTMVGAGPSLPITATFSEALAASSVNVSSFTLTGPDGAVSGTVSLTGDNKASFTPSSPLAFDVTYQAKITTAIRDLSDNALASDIVWSFNTGHKLALGANHACIRYEGGELKCWGRNVEGQLGLGNTNSRGDVPGEMGSALPTVDLGSGRVVVEVAAGGEHTCARLDNSQVKCWGSNTYGQLGLGSTTPRGGNTGDMGDSLPAVQLGSADVVLQLAAGRYFTCARLASGEVKCWGRNDKGQLGLGDTNSRGDQSGEMGNALQAVNLGTGRTAIDISATAYHLCARLDDDTAKCWGENDFGQLGLGDVNSRGDAPGEMGDALPALNAGSGRTIQQIAVNSGHTCAVLDTFDLKCWGHNLYGQLGLGDTDFRGDDPSEVGDAVPTVNFGTGRSTTRVVEGSRHTCVLLDTHLVKCWGYNPDGELGLGDINNRGDEPGEMGDSLPTIDLGSGRTVVELASGSFFACARLDNDDIKCWGRNSDGQLGLGDLNNRGDAPGEMGDDLPALDLSL